jgi:5-enolpyruvylshikimate-3-phosphate synthase
MAEPNGSGRIDDHEERLRKLEAARKEIEDALVVMAHLEATAAARIKEHAQFISDHRTAMSEFDQGERATRRLTRVVEND